MKNFKLVRLNGVNYYNAGSSNIVNMTYDSVNSENFETVNDFNCFTTNKEMKDTQDLTIEVFAFVGNTNLHDVVRLDIEKASDSTTAYKIVKRMESLCSFRENEILANFGSIEVEGNLLSIFDKYGDGFSVDFRKDEITLGEIVG